LKRKTKREQGEARQALIRAGRELLVSTPLKSLSVRKLTQRAGVNLGLFHYYFKTKERFADAVIDEIGEKFIRHFREFPSGFKDPLERLKMLAVADAMAVVENWDVFWMSVRDIRGKATPSVPVAKYALQMRKVYESAIRDCIKAGHFKGRSIDQVYRFIVNNASGVCITHLLFTPLFKGTPLFSRFFGSDVLTLEGIHRRVEFALRALERS